MNRILSAFVCALFLTVFAVSAFAEESKVEFSKPSFTAFNEFGKVDSGVEKNNLFGNVWVQRSGVWVNFTATKNERLKLDMLIGGTYWSSTFNENADASNFYRNYSGSTPRFDVSYVFGADPKAPVFKLDGGVFQYKYNDYSRNLGEYMFRTNAYPGTIYTGGLTYVSGSSAQVTGLKLTHYASKMFSHDLILNLETDFLPLYDVNLSYMARLNLNNVFKINAGMEFMRVLPLAPSRTNPDREKNHYFKYNNVWYVDNKDYYSAKLTSKDRTPADSVASAFVDTLYTIKNNHQSPPISFQSALDTMTDIHGLPRISLSHYNASAIKPVIFMAFDPKPLMNMDIFGPNDLVLYGEAAILGVKDYPVYYDDIAKRIPFMFGFNVPTFKLLDLLAVEGEYYGSDMPTSAESQLNNPAIPIPFFESSTTSYVGYSPSEWAKNDWKWSVLAQRKLIDGFTVSAQAASDHARGWVFPSGRRYWEFFRKPSDWYWMLKLTVNI